MQRILGYYILAAAGLVCALVPAVLFCATYMRGGHPPASGIVVLLMLAVVTPVSLLALVAACFIKATPVLALKWVHAAVGVHGLYMFTLACVVFFKTVLHAPL